MAKKNYTLHRLLTVDDWLKARKDHIGGSEISAILGLNHFMSPNRLWEIKTGLAAPEPENESMELGHLLEDDVVELLERRTGYRAIKATAGNDIYVSTIYPFASASPDRIGYLPGTPKKDSNKVIIEIKTTQLNVNEDELPYSWQCQVQWYMGITGIHKAVIAWLSCGRTFGYKEVDFSQDTFDYMIKAAQDFMILIRDNIRPAAMTGKDIDSMYPRHIDGKISETDESTAIDCEQYRDICKQIRDLEATKSELAERIKLSIGDSEGISYSNLLLATYKAGKDSSKFDVDAFKNENPDLYNKYLKTTPGQRRLLIK